MTTSTPTAQQPTGLQVWQPQDVEKLISDYPEERFIALFPRKVMSQVNPMLAPVIETVVLNPDHVNGGDVYESQDLKQGHVALTKVALRRLMSLAGLSMVDSRRMDDGSEPMYVLWQVTVEMHVPGRPRPERAIGTKEIRLSGDAVKGWSPARLGKAREHMIRMAEAKACNAAVRDLLTLKQQYSRAEIAKPFVVMRWEPNMAHPAVAERFLDNLLPATTSAYGPGADQATQASQLEAGAVAFELAAKVPDEDAAVVDGQFVEVRTNGHATVDRTTGEVVGERAADEPDWFGDAQPTLVDRLRAEASARTEADGLATPAEIDKLNGLMRPVRKGFGRTVGHVFGSAPSSIRDVRQGQVQAILAVAAAMGDDPFRAEWAALAERLETGGQ
jgi:hypothetical protein